MYIYIYTFLNEIQFGDMCDIARKIVCEATHIAILMFKPNMYPFLQMKIIMLKDARIKLTNQVLTGIKVSEFCLVYPCVEPCSINSLQWRHNERDGVSNHNCLLNLLLFRRRSKKTTSSASLAFVRGSHRWSVNSPHKGLVTRKMLPFDDVILYWFY